MPNLDSGGASPRPDAPKLRLIDNWKMKVVRFWSMRVAIGGAVFWGAVAGMYLVWPAFADALPLWFYAVGGVAMSVALVIARIIKQPGIE
jgi:hypothetical protein